MNFANRTTPTSIINGSSLINEDNANTIIYKGNIFSLLSTQICKPSSGSYSLFGTIQPSQATIIYTYLSQNTNQVVTQYQSDIVAKKTPSVSSQPLVILLIVPIYIGNRSNNAPYLEQLAPSSTTQTTQATYPSMQSLFNGLISYGYTACIDITEVAPGATTPFGITTNIYNFTDGITLSSNSWASIQGRIANNIIPTFQFLGSTNNIVQTYNPDGTFATTGSTIIISRPVSVADKIFENSVRYYLQPIATPATASKPKGNLTPEQYQCLPFNQLKNLQTDPKGITTVSLDNVIKNNDTTNATVGFMISWNQLAVLWIPIVVCFGLFLTLALALYIFASDTEPLPKSSGSAPAPTTATAATATATAATAAPASR
jgi:hypothetical protein